MANKEIGEFEAIAVMLDASSALIVDGQVILANRWFAEKEFEGAITDDLLTFLARPYRKDVEPRFGDFVGIRQWVESVVDTLRGQLGLEHHGAKKLGWVMVRVASNMLATASGISRIWKIDPSL
ncbi:hypothetical protein ACT17S_16410 [Glutamicibacter mysorens]